MRIDSLTEEVIAPPTANLKTQVLAYLEEHSDEVFRYRDEDLASALNAKPSAVGFTLWFLEKNGSIEKDVVGGRTFFGSHKAIAELRRKLKGSLDPLERARKNRERIFARVGNIDNSALLDDVREGRW